jgi:hypothetical protein
MSIRDKKRPRSPSPPALLYTDQVYGCSVDWVNDASAGGDRPRGAGSINYMYRPPSTVNTCPVM